ncbi:MAG TPA: hypothetical protein ENI85_16510 [Deltaproteobacteria bacterium]|nr:hypothetical protein [Deltaproteobacteria bacterium]
MRPHQIFSAMSPDKCERVMGRIAEEAPEVFRQTVASAAAALKFRPQYLMKQPMPKRVASIRRALARPGSDPLAEELLAIYFLKCRLDLLTEWLDLMELDHEDGMLTADETPCPEASELEEKVARFRRGKDEDCDLLLRVFAGQTAINWPALDEILARSDA